MAVPNSLAGVIRFGIFELDTHSGELRRSGVRIKLQQQPLQVLSVLLERPGEVVTRDELRERLWPQDVYVDFERSLNSAIAKLREALGDVATSPHFVETLPRVGYRFIASVSPASSTDASKKSADDVSMQARSKPAKRRKWFVASALAALLGGAILVALLPGFNVGRARSWLWSAKHRPVRVLAVLPLSNLSGDPAQDYFADGMTDELITSLARLGDVQVISRTSVMQYKNTKKPLPQIGRDLNVDAIVEGSVVRSGLHVRITAQLVDAATDQHIWAQTYERELGDVLKLQDEAAHDIAQEIHVQIRSTPGELSSRVRPVNPEAYEAYLMGRYFWERRSEGDFQRSIAYFEKAIKADPSYAAAYAGLGDVYQDQDLFLPASRAEAMPKARAAVQKALELDEGLSEAHDSLAGILELDWKWKDAEREHMRAVELNPSNANAHLGYAAYLAQVDSQFDKAIAETQLALRLNPLSSSAHAFSGWVYFFAHQDNRAIEEYRKALEMDPREGTSHQGLYDAYAHASRYDEAMKDFDESGRLEGTDPTILATLDNAYRAGGMQGMLRESLKLHNQGRYELAPIALASLHARLGDKKEAIDILQQCLKHRDPWLGLLKVHPAWDNLRSDPRFQDVVRAVGLTE